MADISQNRVFETLDDILRFIAENPNGFETHLEFYKALFSKMHSKALGMDATSIPSNQEITETMPYLDKLKEDRYITEPSPTHFVLTVKGQVFYYGKKPFWLKGRPYAYENFKRGLSTFWNIFKIIAVVLNALAIIYLTYIQATKN